MSDSPRVQDCLPPTAQMVDRVTFERAEREMRGRWVLHVWDDDNPSPAPDGSAFWVDFPANEPSAACGVRCGCWETAHHCDLRFGHTSSHHFPADTPADCPSDELPW